MWFDHTYCINLEKRPEKWEQAKAEFEKHSIEVERFQGFDGNTFNSPATVSDGDCGCSMSHMAILSQARRMEFKSVLIFEDDVLFIKDFRRTFEEWSEQVPEDWDMLYLGGRHISPLQAVSLEDPFSQFRTGVLPNIGRITGTYTTHAYAVKSTVWDMILADQKPLSKQIDVYYQTEIHPRVRAYSFCPNLVTQRPGYSDIQKAYVDYSSLFRG